MDVANKANRINLLDFTSPPMRAFHMTWFAFFLCFFAWFGIAPFLGIIREELGLSPQQVKNTMIAGVAVTIVARLFIGWLCDRIGPRLCYTWLLLIGSMPVMAIGFSQDYMSFMIFRLLIGVIGASFVITQYHTSVMFAPNCVGTANATSAGWGNLGGGITQMVMPLILSLVTWLGANAFWGWRLSMLIAGVVCFLTGIAYFFLTTDLPDGNFEELRAAGKLRTKQHVSGTFVEACKDMRVWALFVIYGGCFGIELFINGMAALYFIDYFKLSLATAGLVAGLFGLMNIFARTAGGVVGDLFAHKGGLKGRVRWLLMAVFCEGIALMVFSRMNTLPLAIGSMVVFSLFVQMSEGATYSVVPFINKKALGSVSGIVGAGGNVGAVTAGFLFKGYADTPTFLLLLGFIVTGVSFFALFVRFSHAAEEDARREFKTALEERRRAAREKASLKPAPAGFWLMLKKAGALDLLRIYIGLALAVKGIHFILNMQAISEQAVVFGSLDTVVSWFVVFAHVVGGLCLAVGFATRVAAFINAMVLAGAVFFVHAKEGLFTATQGLEFSLLVFFILLLLTWAGSGRLSFDRYVEMNEA